MNYYDTVKKLIVEKKVPDAVMFCETELAKFPSTPFHWVLGKDMLHLSTPLRNFIDGNFSNSPQLTKTKAFYAALNGFSVNWDLWFLDIVAFDILDDYQNEESDWLGDAFWGSSSPEYFNITGWEKLQAAFKNYHEANQYADEQLKLIAELTEFLVVLRLQQLFEHTILDARREDVKWSAIPWGITAHDYFLIYEI